MLIQADQTHILQAGVSPSRELQQALHTAPHVISGNYLSPSAGIMIYNYNNNNGAITMHSQARVRRRTVGRETRADSAAPPPPPPPLRIRRSLSGAFGAPSVEPF